jgi:addiction module HigA family antidote
MNPHDVQRAAPSQHPGFLVRATVLPLYGGNTVALARALKTSRANASNLVNSHLRISVSMARRLEALGHGTARDWLIRQVDYDLEQTP